MIFRYEKLRRVYNRVSKPEIKFLEYSFPFFFFPFFSLSSPLLSPRFAFLPLLSGRQLGQLRLAICSSSPLGLTSTSNTLGRGPGAQNDAALLRSFARDARSPVVESFSSHEPVTSPFLCSIDRPSAPYRSPTRDQVA